MADGDEPAPAPPDVSRGPPVIAQSGHVLLADGVRCVSAIRDVVVLVSSAADGYAVALYRIGEWQHPVYRTFIGCDDGPDVRPRVAVCHVRDASLPCSAGGGGRCRCGQHLVLSASLFQQLFGRDAALLRAPVFVFGLADGRVYWLVAGPAGGRSPPPLLCDLQQAIVGIHAVGDADGSDRLAVTGADGKVLVLTAADPPAVAARHREVLVGGPLLCAVTHGEYLFHSTGKLLHRTSLAKESCETDDGRLQFASNSYQCYNVVAMATTWWHSPKPGYNNLLVCRAVNIILLLRL